MTLSHILLIVEGVVKYKLIYSYAQMPWRKAWLYFSLCITSWVFIMFTMHKCFQERHETIFPIFFLSLLRGCTCYQDSQSWERHGFTFPYTLSHYHSRLLKYSIHWYPCEMNVSIFPVFFLRGLWKYYWINTAHLLHIQ